MTHLKKYWWAYALGVIAIIVLWKNWSSWFGGSSTSISGAVPSQTRARKVSISIPVGRALCKHTDSHGNVTYWQKEGDCKSNVCGGEAEGNTCIE